MKNGFTVIELIFVILILGVLVGVALSRLSAVRNDARVSVDLQNMAQCITDAGALYTARGVDVQAGDLDACDAVVCFTITYASGGNDFSVDTNSSAADFCSRVDDLGGHLIGHYRFVGTNVVY